MGNYVCERKTKEQSDKKKTKTKADIPVWNFTKTFTFPPRCHSHLNTCTRTCTCSLDLRSLTKVSGNFESEALRFFHNFLRRVCSKWLYYDIRGTCFFQSPNFRSSAQCILTSRIGSLEQFV